MLHFHHYFFYQPTMGIKLVSDMLLPCLQNCLALLKIIIKVVSSLKLKSQERAGR
jgi:hypothetical protein